MFFVCFRHASLLTSVQYIPDIHSGGKLDSSVISIKYLKRIFVVVAVVKLRSCLSNFTAGFWCYSEQTQMGSEIKPISVATV
jgi:hypothetical protein